MSKMRILGIVFLMAIILGVIYQYVNLPRNLTGTYIMSENRRNFISFDSNKSGEVLYYYVDETEKQIEEKGTFEKQLNGKYKIECKSIRTDSAVLAGKTLIIEINGQKRIFIKQSDIPTEIITE